METYYFTLLAIWPNGYSELVERLVSTPAVCFKWAMWYAATLRADGVDSIAWACVQQFAV